MRRLLTFILILSSFAGFATHLRSGEIRVVESKGLWVRIEITILTDTDSEIKFGEGLLNFGDESFETTPTKENTRRPDIYRDLGVVVYTTAHTYAKAGTYLLTYMEPNLNGGILNIFNSVETRFYTETSFTLTPDISVSSPKFADFMLSGSPATKV